MASKDAGGLGVASLFALNRGLMFKWVWRFITQKNSLWAKVITTIHGEMVAIKLSHVDLEWSFRRKSRGGAEQIQMTILKEILEGCILSDTKDRWTWSLEGSGKFSVSFIRKTIDAAFLPCGNVMTRWVKEVPIKINILAWKVSNDYLPTRFNLSRRDNDVGTSTHTQNVAKRLFLEMFPYEEPQGSDEISTFPELPLQETRFNEIPTQKPRCKLKCKEPQGSDEISAFTELPLQETRFSEIPTQEPRFTQLYTCESSFPSLGREVKEIDDVFGSTNLSFAKNVTQEDVEDSLRVEDYQLNDMIVDDTVRVDANQNVRSHKGRCKSRCEEPQGSHEISREVEEIDDVFVSTNLSFAKNVTQEDAKDSLRVEDYQVIDMIVDDTVRVDANQNVNHMDVDFSVRVKESKAGLKDMVDEDDYIDEAGMKVNLSGINEDEPQNARGLTCYVPDVMFDDNDLDVINNEEFDSKSGEENDLGKIRNNELKQLKKRILQE
nr:RNA-directed DNA polymerase, eukaryota, reverse transcriptase zinc-binding domain protein [Tanacetum cinerariifolium]